MADDPWQPFTLRRHARKEPEIKSKCHGHQPRTLSVIVHIARKFYTHSAMEYNSDIEALEAEEYPMLEGRTRPSRNI